MLLKRLSHSNEICLSKYVLTCVFIPVSIRQKGRTRSHRIVSVQLFFGFCGFIPS